MGRTQDVEVQGEDRSGEPPWYLADESLILSKVQMGIDRDETGFGSSFVARRKGFEPVLALSPRESDPEFMPLR